MQPNTPREIPLVFILATIIIVGAAGVIVINRLWG